MVSKCLRILYRMEKGGGRGAHPSTQIVRVVRQWLSNVIYQPSCLFRIQVTPLAVELCTKVGVQTLLIDVTERLLWLVMIYR